MKLSDYIVYLGKVWGGARLLSEQTGNSPITLLIDYFFSVLRNGTLIRQYTIGNFWRKSKMEQRRCLTYPRMCKFMNKYNH